MKSNCFYGVVKCMNFGKSLVYSLIVGFMVAIMFPIFWDTNLDEKLKGIILHIGKKAENFIYYEATIHNPEGDILPDKIDDTIFSKIKSIYNK